MTDQERQEEIRRLAAKSDRDLIVQTAAEVASIGRSIDLLRDNGCTKFPDVASAVAGHSARLGALEKGSSSLRDSIFRVIPILVAAAILVFSIIVFAHSQGLAAAKNEQNNAAGRP